MRRSSYTAMVLGFAVAACSKPPAAPNDAPAKNEVTTDYDDHAPPFDLPSLTTAGRASVARGKITLVWFWATWNEPCKKAFPKLQALYAKYRERGLEIIGLSVDEEEKYVGEAAKTWGGTFPVAWDQG